MLMCTLFGGGKGGSQKVYGLYTRENVDIYGRPLKDSSTSKVNTYLCQTILFNFVYNSVFSQSKRCYVKMDRADFKDIFVYLNVL